MVLPYTSSIILVETLEEILSDKIRALYERQYIKGRDIYDVWWLTKKLGISTQWPITQNKFEMYPAPFVAAREADFSPKKGACFKYYCSNRVGFDPLYSPKYLLFASGEKFW